MTDIEQADHEATAILSNAIDEQLNVKEEYRADTFQLCQEIIKNKILEVRRLRRENEELKKRLEDVPFSSGTPKY